MTLSKELDAHVVRWLPLWALHVDNWDNQKGSVLIASSFPICTKLTICKSVPCNEVIDVVIATILCKYKLSVNDQAKRFCGILLTLNWAAMQDVKLEKLLSGCEQWRHVCHPCFF